MSINRGIDKDMVYVYKEISLNLKKIMKSTICYNMDGPRDYHTEWSKLDKDKYHMILLLCEI